MTEDEPPPMVSPWPENEVPPPARDEDEETVRKGSPYFMIHSSTDGYEESRGQALSQFPEEENPPIDGDELKRKIQF